MPKVLDRIKQQWGEGEPKTPELQTAAGKKAYSNMMVYLKELKLHNVKNLELAEQIYLLSENSVEKLNEMHKVLTEKLNSPSDSKDAQELLKRTEFLQDQIGNMTHMLRQVYEKQEAVNTDAAESVGQGITYEEFKEMQDVWRQFEQKMAIKFVTQEDQIKNAVNEGMSVHRDAIKRAVDMGLATQNDVVAAAIKNEMYGFRTDIAEAVRDEIAEYNANVHGLEEESRQAYEDSLRSHEQGIKKEITDVRETLELNQREQYNTMLEELERVKKVVKGYSRTAMWASCLALIVLILDILILK